ncbi:hypothetical protein JAAARDRAFT_706868 [Jaapia argillacea MUCL 33604]|uniref:Uncharacterized protein n=1 Tax=Jaapia argillacea MUCL 33604 TaxID=933084 RepID=A0A067P8E1_9AGAM|nr:hypothetical protein JAAARDRAFT_706868 [Jaapia argillacea MUCL 33604]
MDFLTLKEFRMRTLVSQILEKPNWWRKVHDQDIVEKWRKEFIQQDAELVRKEWRELSEAEEAELFADGDGEMNWREAQRKNVYQSLELIPSHLKAALIGGASVLESVPEEEKDWHPGTEHQVLDLIHPSLHCFRIGKSLVKKDDGTVDVPTLNDYMNQRDDIDRSSNFSTSIQHQWLPTDFQVSSTGEVTRLGYINNLHPDLHKPLNTTITSILERFIPLWDRVLSATLNPDELAITADPFNWYSNLEEKEPNWNDFCKDGKQDHKAYNLAYDKYQKEVKWPVVPDPAPFTPPWSEGQVEFTLKGRKIQVIIKMANIILTPENPKYGGGSWHVEGMENERIVSTGLYYYHSSNISESKLGFRKAIGDGDYGHEIPYEQSDNQGYMAAYGIDGNGGPLNQELGSMVTKEDKCLAFPNIYQHRVAPFKLVDPTKPGLRKILCFFLVDPTKSILSTSQVPPQQYAWYSREIGKAPALTALPLELFDMITEKLVEKTDGNGGVITMEQAKAERQKLMDERANFRVEHNKEIFEMEFNMCEH